VALELSMSVPGPVMLFFLTIVLPALWLAAYGYLFYIAFRDLRRWRRNQPVASPLKLEVVWLLLILLHYPISSFVQAILQSTYVLATTYADDYVGTIASAAGYAGIYWAAVRFASVLSVFIILGFAIIKLLWGVRHARGMR